MSGEEEGIRAMVEAYAAALNSSDVQGIVDTFADDAVLMDLDRPTTNGRERLRADYERGLDLGQVSREFHVDQILGSGEIATVRTHSTGSLTIEGTDKIRSEARELFVLKRVDGEWKIAQYVVQRLLP
ncbi:MAG: nuclear transport factor 2 family protein [Actinomycetota bacterium]